MSMEPLEKIKLACSIIRHFRLRNPTQMAFPFEEEILSNANDITLMNIYHEVMSDHYVPSDVIIIDLPKQKGLIRHLSYLTLKDHILYILLIMDCFPAIYSKTGNDKTISPENVLRSYPVDKTWMKKNITTDLMQNRQPFFNKDFSHILNSDISAFGPNIDIAILSSELFKAGAPQKSIEKLNQCLTKWSPMRHKGIPQIYFATDLISEFYLQPVDQFFRETAEVEYLRESDNFEIWCKTEAACKNMLINLSRILYARGLYLNNNKTNIVSVKSVDRNENPMEHKTYNWRNNFKLKFSNLMNLYYRIENAFLFNECSLRLKKNPDFTEALLEHFESEKIPIDKQVLKFLSSPDAVYPFQNYTLIKWLLSFFNTKEDISIEVIRQMAWDNNNPYYLRSVSRQFIFKYGNDTDKEMIRKMCLDSNDALESMDMQYLCGLKLELSAK